MQNNELPRGFVSKYTGLMGSNEEIQVSTVKEQL